MGKNILNYAVNRRLCSRLALNFVPKHKPVDETDLKNLEKFILESKTLLVLTGAGISTESGIPDYRSEEVGLYARTNHKPIQYQEFLKSASVRRRFWARNFVGWEKFSKYLPNDVHKSIRNLEKHGRVSCVVTQNVDGLHTKAGSENVVELHGSAFRVVCMGCSVNYDRHDVQKTLVGMNPHMTETVEMIRPDGDVEISEESIKNFKPPFCQKCGGYLKPDITFFGDNVPRERVEVVKSAVSDSDAILVLGSSLSVFSGYRIILQAVEEGKNIGIVNIGATRADHLAHLKISTKCGDILPKIC